MSSNATSSRGLPRNPFVAEASSPVHLRGLLPEDRSATVGAWSAIASFLVIAAYFAVLGFDRHPVDPWVVGLLVAAAMVSGLVVLGLALSRRAARLENARLRRSLEEQKEVRRTVALDLLATHRRLQGTRRELGEERVRAEAAREAKNRFLTNISHEIRTPLSAIVGLADLVALHRLSKTQRSRIDELRRSADSLAEMIDQVLDFSRIKAGELTLEPTDCDLRQVICGVVKRLRPRAESKGLELDMTVDAGVPSRLRLDPLRLRQIFLHLVDNAVKFTERGRVRIHVTGSETEPGSMDLRVRVEDSGAGIPEDRLACLFRPFHQLDGSLTRTRGGIGLGLAICERLVGLMDGRMGAENLPGGGSVFWFELPAPTLAPGKARDVFQWKPVPEETGEMDRPRILVVEDNPVNREVATFLLESLGCWVFHADDGVEAVGLVQQERFHLVLMDCQMPTMDGYRATAEIRRREGDGRHVPIIAVTAHAMDGDRERCLAAGMDDYLAKPLSMESLGDALGRWVRVD